MNATWKIMLVTGLVIAVVAVVTLKQQRDETAPLPPVNRSAEATEFTGQPVPENTATESNAALPRLVELGADKCIPCKMMAPILEELRREYAGRLQVDFFDVWKNPGIAQEYRIQSIPTQIFYDASGQELFRHQGYISKDDILAKWKELGVELVSGQ